MKINSEDIYRLFDKIFDYILIISEDVKVIHISPTFAKHFDCTDTSLLSGVDLKTLMPENSFAQFDDAREELLKKEGYTLVAWEANLGKPSIPLKATHIDSKHGHIFIFLGNRFPTLGDLRYETDIQRIERAKELACIYAIAEWIEASASVEDFFTELPQHIVSGMKHPEHAKAYSEYMGQKYGVDLIGGDFIKSDIMVDNEAKGFIKVGYNDSELQTLPEEKKMLDEITRHLTIALERKYLKKNIGLRSDEIEHQKRLLGTLNTSLGNINKNFEETRELFNNIFEAIPDTVAIIDCDHNIVMTNKKEFRKGDKCHKSFFDSDEPCKKCRLKKIFKDKRPSTLEIQNGDSYYSINAMPIFDKEHKVDGIMEFHRDVTDKRNYQEQLQQADKLASLGQLVSGIGHEINNPNQFIRGNVKIVKQSLDDILPIIDDYYKDHPDLKIARLKYDFFREHIMTLVDDMSNGSERIKRIVESLKRFARKDEGELIDNVDINNVIRESVRLVHNQVHKYADTTLNLEENILPFLGNMQKIEQVLINLIINASQAMFKDQRGLIEISTNLNNDQVVIKVSDNGKGMNKRTQGQIFDPFFTTKRTTGGTGLGLSIVYRIIEEHGGTIVVSSEAGEGTEFTISIPVNDNNSVK
ncbi:MAG: GHKL domain-containing protein [Deltaproteobacteria bacterium]|jgi:signal transduction histidine kinase|nr:GHKL domain-containing protein [Deltaproteobacteria bacterium]